MLYQILRLEDLPIHIFPKQPCTSLSSCGTSQPVSGPSSMASGASSSHGVDTPTATTSSASWDLQSTSNSHVQLNDTYKSVSSLTGSTSYMGRSVISPNDNNTFGNVRSVSPTLPPVPSTAIVSKSQSPSLEGPSLEKPTTRRAGDRKKKTSKNVLRETLINPQDMPGYKGLDPIDKLLEFVEGNQGNKAKKPQKEKKRDPKPKERNEKQLLSKAASLDENTLGYGSKNGDDGMSSRSRASKDIEKKNSANITKSSTAICTVEMSEASINCETVLKLKPKPSPPEETATTTPLVNGTVATPTSISKNVLGKPPVPPNSTKPSSESTKTQAVTEKPESAQSSDAVPIPKSDTQVSKIANESQITTVVDTVPAKAEEEKLTKPDESDGPYVLVQSKKKREKKKGPQREPENFPRSHVDQSRRDGGRVRRGNSERRKSVGSVPGSENSECSDDDDSVRSLPAGECTPRERIPKPCSSSGGTPQTSYADIARMSRDENGIGKGSPSTNSNNTSPISNTTASVKTPPSCGTVPAVAVPSDSNFPALHTTNNTEKTAPVVGAAVWPCRQRLEFEPSPTKENATTNSAKAEDASLPNTNSFSPHLCSSKLLFETKESCSPGKVFSEKVSAKDLSQSQYIFTSTPPKESELESKEALEIKCNGSINNIILPPGVKLVPSKKSDKGRDRSIKVSVSDSGKGLENGDLSSIHPTEAVVFCGGKFDGSNIPVGPGVDFEFGFGVIEAMNDINGMAESSFTQPLQNDSLIISTVPGKESKEPAGHNRSQDDINRESLVSKVKSTETQVNKSDPTKTKVFSTSEGVPAVEPVGRDASGGALASLEKISAGPQHADAKSVDDVVDSPAAKTVESTSLQSSTPNVESTAQSPESVLPSEKVKEGEAGPPSQAADESPEENNPAVSGIAQMYLEPQDVKLPDTVTKAYDYMNNYATRLSTLGKQGKVSIYRIV